MARGIRLYPTNDGVVELSEIKMEAQCLRREARLLNDKADELDRQVQRGFMVMLEQTRPIGGSVA